MPPVAPRPRRRLRRPRALAAPALLAALALPGALLAGCGSSVRLRPPKLVWTADVIHPHNVVTVSPFPGTLDASPRTQISFLGRVGTRVAQVSVVGSVSGTHTGRLAAYSTDTGESFLPKRPFVPGERVRVRARVTDGAAATTVHTHFTVGFAAHVPAAEFPRHPGSAADVQHYRSAPSLTPSTVTVTTPARSGATPGDFFLAPYQGAGSAGPMIVDQQGGLVWFHPLAPGESATNLRPQRYDGRTVLTWWQGRILKLGFGQGEDEIYSTSYRPLARVRAGNGYRADLHEFLLTPHATAWIDAFDPVRADLRSIGGLRHGEVTDSVIQEIDVRTGLVMWEWHALGHIPLRDSFTPIPHDPRHYWDYVHINSISPGSGNQLLLSSRSTWAVFDVDMHTGELLWRIGGRYSSFRRGPGTWFYYQHDAEWQPGGLVSIFDNGASPPRERQSRGLLLRPDLATHTVTLVRQFTNPHATLLASSQGNLLNLGDGDWLMGYGGLPNFTEYSSSGTVLFDATLGPDVQDFRTYLAPWSATPASPPALAAQSAAGGGVTVEASWNGATAVAGWRVLAGPSRSSLAPVATVPRSGFETTATIPGPASYVAVQALDAAGHALATSAAVAPSGP